ncbi:phosphatidylserine decarboxylase proenzyme [Campylobacterota bacterium]|nr:phosphatidylserine decarboxylase proenzyme [Campylobacterota bacterium]
MHTNHITNLMSRAFGRFADYSYSPKIQRAINTIYVRLMKLDMSEFDPPQSYATLNALFTRSLKTPRELPSDPNAVIAPCDSLITECGSVSDQTLFQIKGMSYDLANLLPHLTKEQCAVFEGANYQNFYLAPRDYHRYHAPIDMHITRLTHISGKLLPVNLPFLRGKLNLFCENERVVLEAADTRGNGWIMVFVGALNVGKMHFNFLPKLETNTTAQISLHDVDRSVRRGEQLGYFKMGSTILIISAKTAATFCVSPDQKIRFGDTIGSY